MVGDVLLGGSMPAAITVGQIAGAISTTQQLVQQAQSLIQFLNQVQAYANNGWEMTQSIGGYNVTFSIGSTDQTNLLAQYETLKSALSTTYGSLP
jgi:hypothetical protein